MDGWPDEFNFSASCAGRPTRLDGVHAPPPDPGWHVQSSGTLELVPSGCSVMALVAYHVRRAQLRQ
jgi:hypothetical protein